MIWIGIDCGENTGLAIWDSEKKEFLKIATMQMHKAMDTVRDWAILYSRNMKDLHVVFEDARQRKWIPRERSVSEYRGKLMGAGSVKRDAAIWEEFLQDYRVPYTAQAPHAGMTKLSQETFNNLTGWTARSSNHSRDAAMLVFGR